MAEENKIFTVEIITPDRIFYKGEGDMIEFTTAVGEILANKTEEIDVKRAEFALRKALVRLDIAK